MKELKLLFTEAWKEAKSDPLEAMGSIIVVAFITGWLYFMMIMFSDTI